MTLTSAEGNVSAAAAKAKKPSRRENLIYNRKASIGPCEDGDQAERRHSRSATGFALRFSGPVVNLPCQCPALFPRHAFGPGQKRVALGIGCKRWMLSSLGRSRRRDWFQSRSTIVNLALRFPRGEHA